MLGFFPIADRPISDSEFSGSGETTAYFASESYTSLPGDTQPDRHYKGVITSPLRFRRSVIGSSGLVEFQGSGAGAIEFNNLEGDLDAIVAFGGVDGRSVRVRAVPKSTLSLDDAEDTFLGIAREVEFDLEQAAISVTSRDGQLRTPIQSDTFAGTGGAEGGDDLQGQRKPAAFGKSWGVEPVYLGVISGNHSYLASGGTALPINDVPAVYDRGVSLTKVGSSPSAGEYSVDTSTGLITIGGTPDGTITCDIEGYAPSGSFKQKTGEIVLAILEDFAQVSNTRIDFNSFDALNNAQTATVGIWVGTETRTSADVIAELMRGITGWGGFNRLDNFEVGRVQEPGGSIRAIFDETNTLRFERVPGPDVINPNAWQHLVGWKKNYTVATDIASGASDAQRAFMAKPFRTALAQDSDVAALHLLSAPFFTPGLFSTESEAQTEADRLIALLANKRLWRITSKNASPNLDIGQTVELRQSRFGLNRKLGYILGVEIDLATRETMLEVLA